MKIYNIDAFNRNSRFLRALLAGLAAAIVLGIACGTLISSLHVEAAILYIGVGWAVGEVIKKAGHGVGTKFCVLGAVLTLFAILISDTIMIAGLRGFGQIVVTPSVWFGTLRTLLAMNLSLNISRVLGLMFRIVGIYYGYSNAGIL